jgi:iron-sulfur cluster repair protein YtfE (RIC family)
MAAVEPEVRRLTNTARRTILCQQHESLRKRIDATRQLAFAALAGGAPATRLASSIALLQAELELHLETEEALLEPILACIDAWGPMRLDRLRAEHRQQRAFLMVLADPSAEVETAAHRTIAFCNELFEDMEYEERELFGEDVLRDDCVLLDAVGD